MEESNKKVVYRELQELESGLKFDIDKTLTAFKDNGWLVTDINVIRKAIGCGCKEKAVTFDYSNTLDNPKIVFRSTVDGKEATTVSLSTTEMAMFTFLLTFDFSTLAKLFIKMNEV